jgi:hypothetical protein
MGMHRFAGKWAGQYTFGDGYSDKLKEVSVPFSLIMQVESGIIKGTCIDEGYADFENPAIIKGTIEAQYIEFTKQYPYRWYLEKDGTVVYQKDRRSQEVLYLGEFRNNVFAGKWGIYSKQILEDGTKVDKILQGHWIMHKDEFPQSF